MKIEMTAINYTVEQRIEHLRPEIDARLRSELLVVCRMLTQLNYSSGVITTLSRLSLIFLSILLDSAKVQGPSDQLNACIEHCRVTPSPSGRGTLLNSENAHSLHAIRVLSNKAVHAVDSAHITSSEAETAIALFLRVLEWFYTLCEWGPRIDSLTSLPGDTPRQNSKNSIADAEAYHPSLTFSRPPKPRNPFVGRQIELKTVCEVLEGEARLLTLTGSGGCGKTRLAVEVAAVLESEYEGGIAYVELATVSDSASAVAQIKTCLGLREKSDISELVRGLLGRRALVIFDNCEHVIDIAATAVDQMLRVCPDVKILTTSREPLEVEGEITFRVPSLSVPRLSDQVSERSILQYDAVKLFSARARAANPGFKISDSNAPSIAEICSRLDGIPLAIELAASRARVLTPDQILQRLAHRFSLLTTGNRSSLPRHQTLRAAIDWSYQLLHPYEQAVLRRTACLRGTFSYVVAHEISSFGEVDSDSLLDAIDNLVDKSLLVVEGSTDDLRYRYLESVREFGMETLGCYPDESRETQARLSKWAHEVVQNASVALRSERQVNAINILQDEEPNVLGCIDWAIREGDILLALQLSSQLWRYFYTVGKSKQGIGLLGRLIGLVGDEVLDPLLAADSYRALALLMHSQNQLDDATRACAQAISYAEKCGSARVLAGSLGTMGLLKHSDGLLSEAEEFYSRSLSEFRKLGSAWGCGLIATNLAELSLDQNNVQESKGYLDQAVEYNVQVGDVRGEGYILVLLAREALLRGEFKRALSHFRKAVDKFSVLSHLEGLAKAYEVGVVVWVSQGLSDEAAKCLGLADGYRILANSQRTPLEEARLSAELAKIRDVLVIEHEAAYSMGFSQAMISRQESR